MLYYINNFNDNIQTKVHEIDMFISELKMSDINIIYGQAKSGKSRLAQKIAFRTGLDRNVIYVNRQDTVEQIRRNLKDELRYSKCVPDITILQPDMSLKEIDLNEYSNKFIIIDDQLLSKQILKSNQTNNNTLLLVLQTGVNDTVEEIYNRYSHYPTIII